MIKLIIIGIVITSIILISLGANLMSEYSNSREQELDQSSYVQDNIPVGYDPVNDISERYGAKTLECLRLVYHCDISNEYFENCISGKKGGITIEEICSSSDIVIENGCATVEFDDENYMIICE